MGSYEGLTLPSVHHVQMHTCAPDQSHSSMHFPLSLSHTTTKPMRETSIPFCCAPMR